MNIMAAIGAALTSGQDTPLIRLSTAAKEPKRPKNNPAGTKLAKRAASKSIGIITRGY